MGAPLAAYEVIFTSNTTEAINLAAESLRQETEPGIEPVVLNTLLANPSAQKFHDRTIFVCAMGERSAVASEMAVALGVKDVVNFRGGTKAWKDAGLPLETP